jgi:hypothetical protein
MEEDSAYDRLRAQEGSALAEVGFVLEQGELWSRNEILFGRNAALQSALRESRELHERRPEP